MSARGPENEDALALAAGFLREARSVTVLTGAGVSAESGVPTFRDAQTGLWSRYDPETLATPRGFAADPGLVWRWYMSRLGSAHRALPNPGHDALARLESWMRARSGGREEPAPFTLVTQNVDDLHERAGSTDVLHLHGSIHLYRCSACGHPHSLRETEREAPQPPKCSQCAGPVRPDIVWFGEELPAEVFQRASHAAGTCDVMLVVGASGLVYPAALLPHTAKREGASVIDVNPSPGPITAVADLFLQGPSGRLLPQLLDALCRARD